MMTTSPIVRIARGHFASERYDEVRRLAEASAESLIPALKQLRGLLYFHAAVDPVTNTVEVDPLLRKPETFGLTHYLLIGTGLT